METTKGVVKRQLDSQVSSDHVEKVQRVATEPNKPTLDESHLDEPHPPDVNQTLAVLDGGINTAQPNSALTENFLGREEELARLTSAIESNKRKHLIDVAITGMSGVGKTLLVQKFIKANISKFHHVIWIQAETEAQVINEFVNLAKELNIIRASSNVKHTGSYLKCFISNIYKMLNESKTVIIFDNLFINVNKFLPPVGVKTENVTIIVTSQFIEWQCNLHIALQCFSPDISEQFLVQHLENCSSENAQKLAQTFDHLPLALQNLVLYSIHTKKVMSLYHCDFTNDHLMYEAGYDSFRLKITDVSKYSYDPGDICKFNPSNLSTHTSGIMSMCDLAFECIAKHQHGDLAMRLLKLMAYLIPHSIEVSLFEGLKNVKNKQDINNAIILLHNFYLISFKNGIISISTVIQYIIRNLYDKETLLKELLSHFKSKLETNCVGKVPHISFKCGSHLMNIYNEHVLYNFGILKKFDVLFLAGSSIGSKQKVIKNTTNVYDHISDDTKNIVFHCMYIEILCRHKEFNLAYKTYMEIIENCDLGWTIEYLKQTFYGLQILHFASLSLYYLNKIQESWDMCDNVYKILRLKYKNTDCKYNEIAIRSLTLLVQISCSMAEQNQSIQNLEYSFNLLDEFVMQKFDWIDSIYNSEDMNMIGIVIKYYIKTNQPSVGLDWITNLKNRLVKQYDKLKSDDDDEFEYTDLRSYLDYNISLCLLELNEIQKAWDILYEGNFSNLAGHKTEEIILLCKIAIKINENYRLQFLTNCVEKLKELIVDDDDYEHEDFNQTIKCIQLLEKDLTNYDMESIVLILYDSLEKRMKNIYSMDSVAFTLLSSRIQLFKSMYIYEHGKPDEAFQTLTRISNIFNLDSEFTYNTNNSIITCISPEVFRKCEKILADKYDDL